MKILKDENELNTSDLMNFPVWEFAFEESKAYPLSSILIKPCTDPPPHNMHESRYLIRTTFRLASGMVFIGYTKPFDLLDQFTGHLSPIDLQPVIVTTKGRVVFWYGINGPKPEEIAEIYLLLGQKPSEVFPIKFELDMEILNGISKGTIDGFMYCEEDEVDDFFHMKEADIKFFR
jgi:hypothetical protein